jgi:hypothetical protein
MKSRVMPALAFLLIGAFASAQAPVTFDWNAGLQTVGMLSDFGAGTEGNFQDALSVTLELAQGAGRGLMSYRLGGEVQYTPQLIAPGAPPATALTAYPTESGITFELPPRGLTGLWFRAALGRLELSDPTGILLYDPDALVAGQLADGFLVELRYQRFFVAAGAGYLGLLDKRLNRVRFTPSDDAELADPSVYFAPQRGLAILRLEAADLVAGQQVGLFGVGQKDFRPAPPTFDSWYIGAVARGPIALGFRHETALIGAISVPSGAETGFGLLLDTMVAYRIPVSFLNEAWLSVLWASSPGSTLAGFPALAGPAAGGDFQEPLTDTLRVELGMDAAFTVPPAGSVIRPAFAGRLLFRPSGQPPAGYSSPMAGGYVGIELELSARWEPVPGMRVAARTGALIAPVDFLPYVRLEAGVGL